MREAMAGYWFRGGRKTVWRSPSMRKRMASSCSAGSTWMSEAPSSCARAKTDKISYEKGDTVTVTLDIENVGRMDGDEVVQLYAAPSGLPMTVPKKQLRAFTRVFVPRDETVTATLSFPVSDLSYWNINKNQFDLFSGNYTLMIGASSADIRRTDRKSVV